MAFAAGVDEAAVGQVFAAAWQALVEQGVHSLHSLFPDAGSLQKYPISGTPVGVANITGLIKTM